MRILHLSDLHIRDSTAFDQNVVIQALFADLQLAIDQGAKFDLVLFSGDLAFAGQKAQFELARSALIEPLMAQLSLDNRRFVATPGNHDMDRSQISRINEAGLFQTLKSRADVDHLLDNSDELKEATARLQPWREFRDSFYGGSLAAGGGDELTDVHQFEIDGQSVAVVCLNSAWRATGSAEDADYQNLLIGDRQVKRAIPYASPSDIRIAMAHHPLNWLRPFDSADIARGLSQNFDIFATGHTHETSPAQIADPSGAYVHSQAGSLYGDGGREWANSYSILEIDPDTRGLTLTVRQYIPNREQFDYGVSAAPGGRFDTSIPVRQTAVHAQAAATIGLTPQEFDDRRVTAAEALVKSIRDKSVLAPSIPEEFADSPFASANSYLVPPSFRSAPQGSSSGEAGKDDKTTLDPEKICESQVVTVGAADGAGLTSALHWLALYATKSPTSLLIPIALDSSEIGSGQRAFDVAIRVALVNLDIDVRRDEPLPAFALSIDDAHLFRANKLARLVSFVQDHPECKFFIGFKSDGPNPLTAKLVAASIAFQSCYLARLGRRQIREMVKRVAPQNQGSVSGMVEQILTGEDLARTPFVASALVTLVAADETIISAGDETAVVRLYSEWLLGRNNRFENPRVDMTYRNRQHLLSAIAEEMVVNDTGVISAAELEGFLLAYFRGRGWHRPVTSVIDDLVDRWVLFRVDEENFAFRQRALHQYFTALRTQDDSDFRARMLETPLEYAQVIEYMAGTLNNDTELLERCGRLLPRGQELSALSSEADEFSATRPWPSPPPEEDGVDHQSDDGDAVDAAEREPLMPSEELFDDAWDKQAAAREQSFSSRLDSSTLGEIESLQLRTVLPATVLRNSELVANVELKSELLVDAIRAFAENYLQIRSIDVPAEFEKELTREVQAMLGVEDMDGDDIAALIGDMRSALAQFIVVGSMHGSLATRKLRDIIESLIDNPPDLLATEGTSSALLAILALEVEAPSRIAYAKRVARAFPRADATNTALLTAILMAYVSAPKKPGDLTQYESIIAEIVSGRYSFDSDKHKNLAKEQIVKSVRSHRAATSRTALGST